MQFLMPFLEFHIHAVFLIINEEGLFYSGPQVHTKFKSLTPNLNHSHYIQITRAEFKSPTPNSNY